jgi:hypothetical protein
MNGTNGTNGESERKLSKRGRPTKCTPETVAIIAEAIAKGLTDREAGLLADVHHDTMTMWRKNPEFSAAVEKATAERLLQRIGRIEEGAFGWQGTAWCLERLHPARFARPETLNQIAVVNQTVNTPAEKVIVLPGAEFDSLIGRPGYQLRDNGDLVRNEGNLTYAIVRQQPAQATLPIE